MPGCNSVTTHRLGCWAHRFSFVTATGSCNTVKVPTPPSADPRRSLCGLPPPPPRRPLGGNTLTTYVFKLFLLIRCSGHMMTGYTFLHLTYSSIHITEKRTGLTQRSIKIAIPTEFKIMSCATCQIRTSDGCIIRSGIG